MLISYLFALYPLLGLSGGASGRFIDHGALGNTSLVVNLPYGSFRGKEAGGITSFLGMPFAAPPIGPKRFGLPEPPLQFEGVRDAVSFGATCPQQNLTAPPKAPFPSIPISPDQSEDCLTINVVKPSNIPRGKQLPVLFYIQGGAFQVGRTTGFNESILVNRSVALNEPVIFVSANYRVNAFGFLGGKEVQNAGIANAGFHDQHAALRWINQHISKFAGDPQRVTIWGQSAGAVSVALHMVVNDGNNEGLFRGSIMESGSPVALPKVQDRQKIFNILADSTGCGTSSNRLDCLRQVPLDKLMAGVNQTPNFFGFDGLNIPYMPMIDGKLFVRDPLTSVQQGKYAKVPIVTGDAEDEGTVFGYGSLNVTTGEQFLQYMKANLLPHATDDQLKAVATAYPEDPSQGSPFHTGAKDALTPQFKRINAYSGDFFFQSTRRFFLGIASKTQPAYAYRYLHGANTPGLGAYHNSDVGDFFGTIKNADFATTDTTIYFTNYGNPNAPKDSISKLASLTWEKWSSSAANPPLLTFVDQPQGLNITFDTYRKDQIKLMGELHLEKVGTPF